MIEVRHVLANHLSGMCLTQYQHKVQTFAADTADKSLANRIGFRCITRGVNEFDCSAFHRMFEVQAIFGIIVTN